uniref:Uncharacterized protein n=1 Tax=Anguilla anguilla TaxID=7936 RepID=A0A0E9PC91_ANGAN
MFFSTILLFSNSHFSVCCHF